MDITQTGIELSSGLRLPPVSLGTWDIRTEEQATQAVKAALDAGYRGIDTAACYENEDVIRQGLEAGAADRGNLMVTSKLWNNAHGYESALRAFDETETRLGGVDLYLIHWPGPVPSFLDTWPALEKLYSDGRVSAIGVSNFMVPQLEILLDRCRIAPMVNQIECHLWYMDRPLLSFCHRNGIAVQGFSPLGAGTGLLSDPVLEEVADRICRTPAQTALRYLLQNGISVIPKSSNPHRIATNSRLFDFAIQDNDMKRLDRMNRLVRTNKDPLHWFGQDYE